MIFIHNRGLTEREGDFVKQGLKHLRASIQRKIKDAEVDTKMTWYERSHYVDKREQDIRDIDAMLKELE